jgi:hypothetical protein
MNTQKARAIMGGVFLAYRAEIVERRRTEVPVQVFEVRAETDAPGLPGGSIVIASGRRDAPLMRALRAAGDSGDAAAAAQQIRGFWPPRAQSRRPESQLPPTGEIISRVADLPVLTEIAYHGKTLVEGLACTPDLEAMAAVVPFAGGRLNQDDFAAIHYTPADQPRPTDLETVILVRQPRLTELEQELLDLLPDADSDAAIGSADLAVVPGPVAEAVAVAVFVVAEIYAVYWFYNWVNNPQQVPGGLYEDAVDEQAAEGDAAQGEQAAAQEAAANEQGGDQIDQQAAEEFAQQVEDALAAEQEDEGDADAHDLAQQQVGEQENNNGDIEPQLRVLRAQGAFSGLDPRASVATLVQVRTQLMRKGAIR